MKQLKAIDLRQNFALRPEVRSIDYNEAAKAFLVGTRGGEIFEIEQGGKMQKPIVSGHYATSKTS